MKGKGKGTNPNSKKALEPTKWKKGICPNPKGRPVGSISLKERMARYMEMKVTCTTPDVTTDKVTLADDIILTLLTKSRMGDIPAIKETLDRYYGKETQKLDIMTPEKVETVITMEERIKKYARDD